MPALAGAIIIAMSVYGSDEDRVRAREAGFDEYLVKPVDKAMLLSALDRHIGHRPVGAPGQSVLVVEDDAPTREFIAELLTGHGYVVATACDGAQARLQVAANLPEIVILDLMLPGVNGFQLLDEWRAIPAPPSFPCSF